MLDSNVIARVIHPGEDMQNAPLIDDVRLIDHDDMPTFVFITSQYERLTEYFKLFSLSIIPVDVPIFRQLPLPENVDLPEDASLRLEFALDDVNPNNLLWVIHINADKRTKFHQLNHQNRRIAVVVKDAQGKQKPMRRIQEPYLLDWGGLVGLSMYMRVTIARSGREWGPANAQEILKGMQDSINHNGGYVSSMHGQMGLIYRTLGDFKQAEQCYIDEILGARRQDGTFNTLAVPAFAGLGVLYKRTQQLKKAADAFNVGLSIHPNHFESLVSIAGVLEDQKLAFRHLARAFCLRPQDPIWNQIVQSLAAVHQQPPQNLFNYIQSLSNEIDLAHKPTFDRAAFNRLGFIH